MSGWGVNLVGYAATLEFFQDVHARFNENVTYIVGPTVNYAIYHELGTSKMEARPFARPAAERVQANLDSKVDRFLEVGILEAGEGALVRATALAVQREMQTIIEQKDIWDIGTLHGSVTIERVR